jgi:hypothetical protein
VGWSRGGARRERWVGDTPPTSAMPDSTTLVSLLRPRNLLLAIVAVGVPSAAIIGVAEAAPKVVDGGAPNVAKGAVPVAAGGSLQLHCRGPFLVDVGASASIRGRKAGGSAGAHGRNLASGECAVIDRPMGASERPIVQFSFASSLHPMQRDLAAVSALTACGLDPQCVVNIVASVDDQQIFAASSGMTFTMHRFGSHPDQ